MIIKLNSMGNCCNINTSTTDNEAENFIRECLTNLKIRRYGYSEFDEVIINLSKVPLVEICSDSISKWISNENYINILENNVLRSMNTSISEASYSSQKCVCLNFREISQEENKLFFFFWTLAMTKTKSTTDKVAAIEKIIVSNFGMSTFSTFRKFLTEYFQLVLIKLTNNFEHSETISESQDINKAYKRLATKVYSNLNVESYVNSLLENLLKNYLNKKRNSLDNTLNKEKFDNEFLNNNILLLFFRENNFLLDVFELRNNFYSIYSSPYDNI